MNSKLYVLLTQSAKARNGGIKNTSTSILYEVYRISTKYDSSSTATNELIVKKMAAYNKDNKTIEFTMADLFIWNRRNDLKGKLFKTGMVDNKPYINKGQKLSDRKWVRKWENG